MSNHSYGSNIVLPYILHMIIWGVLLLCALYGLLRCQSRIIAIGFIIAIINIFYGFIVIVVTSFA